MKKIFTLLFVAATLSGMSTAKAAKAKPWNLEWDTIASRNLYEECVIEKVFTVGRGIDRKVRFFMDDVAKDKNGEYTIVDAKTGLPFPDEILLGSSTTATEFKVSYKHKRLCAEADKAEGYEGSFTIQIDTTQGLTPPPPPFKETIHYRYFNHPTINIKYTSGGLSMDWKNGYDSTYWSVDNGATWYTRSKNTLSSTEIASLDDRFKIIVREPNGCGDFSIFEKGPSSNMGIARPISITNETDAMLNYPTNQYIFVASGTDFEFIVTPKGNQVPVVSTSRNNTLPDKDGVKIHDNGDGTYSVSILSVQEPLDIIIKYDDNANIEADNNKVWTNNGMLYIASAISGNAKVYNLLGALNRTVTFSAGETMTLPLPSGVYVVLMNDGKAYKVAVK